MQRLGLVLALVLGAVLLAVLARAFTIALPGQPFKVVPFQRQTVMQGAFAMLDTQGTGRLVPSALPRVSTEVFRRYDSDGDGCWNVTEFARAVASEGAPRDAKTPAPPRARRP